MIDAGIERARRVERSEALKKVEKKPEGNEEGRQHRLIVEYDRRTGPALRQTLHNNYEAAANRDIRFKKMFPKTPKPVFTKGKNIKQMLIRAKLPKPRPVNTRLAANKNMNGVTRCSKGTGKNGCKACPLLTKHPKDIIKEVKINSSGETIKVEGKINCKTENILYVLQSEKNPKQYGGETGRAAGQRALEHARDIQDEKIDKAVP